MKVSLAHALGTACAACLSVVLTVNPSQAGGGQFVANPVAAAESELTLIGQNPEAIARIRQLNAEWDQAVADRDLDRLVDFFAADPPRFRPILQPGAAMRASGSTGDSFCNCPDWCSLPRTALFKLPTLVNLPMW